MSFSMKASSEWILELVTGVRDMLKKWHFKTNKVTLNSNGISVGMIGISGMNISYPFAQAIKIVA
jgi:hypothetical protein